MFLTFIQGYMLISQIIPEREGVIKAILTQLADFLITRNEIYTEWNVTDLKFKFLKISEFDKYI